MEDGYPLELMHQIQDYLDFLRDEYSLLVTYHLVQYLLPNDSMKAENYLDPGTIYREHINPLCSYFKSELRFWDHCKDRQNKIVDKIQHGSFCGMCWAGMTEFIYPIRDEHNKNSAFICVSGYCVDREKAVPRIRYVCDTYGFSFEHAMEIFDNTGFHELPDKRRLDILIHPLCSMFTLLITYVNSKHASNTNMAFDANIGLYTSIRQYIETVYASNLTMDDLCKRYNYSASYISRLLRKYGNTSLKKLVTTLRINLACSMLSQSDYSIQYIATATGFSDANYFSTVFSKYNGISPREYRNKLLSDHT